MNKIILNNQWIFAENLICPQMVKERQGVIHKTIQQCKLLSLSVLVDLTRDLDVDANGDLADFENIFRASLQGKTLDEITDHYKITMITKYRGAIKFEMLWFLYRQIGLRQESDNPDEYQEDMEIFDNVHTEQPADPETLSMMCRHLLDDV